MDNKSVIMECALSFFAARGYEAVGVQEICEAAGITKPTLYHYFGSKRGLLETVLSESFDHLKEKLQVAAAYQGDLPLTLERVAETYFDFAKANPVFYRLQMALWFAPRERFEVVTLLNRFQYEMIEKIFLAAVIQHGNMRGRHQAYTLTFLGMLNNYIGLGLNELAELNVNLARQAVHQFQHGIYS
jgi:TetR/AcrR family transcriptional regulator